MQLQRLTGLEIKKLAQDYTDLLEKIEGYEAILASEEVLLDIIREDIYEIKEKYGDKRKTKIAPAAQDIDIEDLIAQVDVIVVISHSGYIKRMPMETYRKQARGGRGIIGSNTKQGDFIEHLFIASTHDYLLFFTDRGKCYWLKVYDIPSMSRQSKGRNIINLLDLGEQKITSVMNVSSFDKEQKQLVMATKKGYIKKTKLSAYGNPRSTGVIAIKLEPDDTLIGVDMTKGNDHVILGTEKGKAIHFDEKQVRSMGRVSRGVKGIKLKLKDNVVGMVIAAEDTSLLTVCEKGYGKRTNVGDYRTQKRGGFGLINIKTSKRNGDVVAIKAVCDDDDLMMVTANGIIIRTGLEQIRIIGRNTQGVRLIKLDTRDKLVAVEKIAVEDDPDEKQKDKKTQPTENKKSKK